jgi:hypothetical protein
LNAELEQRPLDVRVDFRAALASELGRFFGDTSLDNALKQDAEGFLDTVEIVAELASQVYSYSTFRGSTSIARVLEDPDELFNDLFDRHRFGYRMESGRAVQIGSPLLTSEIVGPALLATQREGWEHVDRSFREAVEHQRREDELGDALTAAAAAVEAALKAAGYVGATLGDLSKSYAGHPPEPGFSPKFAEQIANLLTQLMAWRSHSGSAHGKPPGADGSPPPRLVALAIHWAGAFIVYLADATAPE